MPVERLRRAARALALLAVAAPLLVGPGAARAQAAPAATAPATLAVCGSCHGADGNATIAHWPSLAGQPRVFIETQLVLIREGLRDVPEMKAVVAGLSDAQIGALATYYAARTPALHAGPVDAARAERGAAKARQGGCGSCHLPDYAGQQQVPRLAGQNEAYLVASMKQFRDHPGPGRDTVMASTLRGASDADLADLAHHLAHFRR